jgi:hypothetical protein
VILAATVAGSGRGADSDRVAESFSGVDSAAFVLPESAPAEFPSLLGDSGLAHATDGVLVTAIPTPSATAKAPTRPTYMAPFVIAVLLRRAEVAGPTPAKALHALNN